MRIRRITLALATTCFALACGGDPESSSRPAGLSRAEWSDLLPEAEVFNWKDQPISFSPPPATWERQREQSGGLFGVRFIKVGSVGEVIHVAEVSAVGRQDRCSQLNSLMREIDELDRRSFLRRLQRARMDTAHPINESDRDASERINSQLDDARQAYLEGDRDEVQNRISTALWLLDGIEYRLEEVIDRVIFEEEDMSPFGDVTIFEPEPFEVAGEVGLTLDYSVDSRERKILYEGRQIYVLHDNRLFVAGFHGLNENLALFDAIVDTISFPESPCDS